jgi:hypothetical protein
MELACAEANFNTPSETVNEPLPRMRSGPHLEVSLKFASKSSEPANCAKPAEGRINRSTKENVFMTGVSVLGLFYGIRRTCQPLNLCPSASLPGLLGLLLCQV